MFAVTRHLPWQDARGSITRRLNRMPESLCDFSYPLYLVVAGTVAVAGVLFMLMFPVTVVLALTSLAGSLFGGSTDRLWTTLMMIPAGAIAAWTTVVIARNRTPLKPGIALQDQEAPLLADIVTRFLDLYSAPSIAKTVITEDSAIEITRMPLAGLPVWFSNRLEIGLPLLIALTPLHLEGLLAGKIGQFSGRYDRVSAWLATQAMYWQYRQAGARGVTPPDYILRAFTGWFVPLYAWLSRPARRRYQLEFDRCAHDVLSVQDQADMLATQVVVGRFLEERYWPTIQKSAERVPEPGFMPYANLEHVLENKLRGEDVQSWLRKIMAVRDDGLSATPTLRTRLEQIGQERIGWPDFTLEKAMYRFLDANREEIIERCDRAWVEQVRDDWRARFERSQGDRNRLRALKMKLQQRPLHGKDAMAYAALTKRLCDREQAIEAHKNIVATNPSDAKLNYGAGKYLVSVGDPAGVKALERAMELDKQYVDPACRLISDFVVSNQRQSALRKYVSATAKAG